MYTLNDGDEPKFSTSSRLPDYGIGTLAIGGKHIFSKSWLSWDISASRARQLAAAGNPGADFKYDGPDVSSICTYDPAATTNIHLPQFNPACTAAGSPVFDPANYYLSEFDGTSGVTSQVNLQGAISYARNYHLGSHASTFEFGAKVRNAHKGQDAYSPVYDNVGNLASTGGPPTMDMFLSGFTNPHYYFGDYRIGPVTDYNKITSFFGANPAIFPLDEGATRLGSDASNYDLTERVSAAYAMNTVELGRFRLQTGLRVEATQLNTLGFIVTNDANGNYISTAPAASNSWYWDPLPSVQLLYRITDNSDIRAVYGRGISGPIPTTRFPMSPSISPRPRTASASGTPTLNRNTREYVTTCFISTT